MAQRLTGKCALITGVSRKRGIGFAVAKAFAREGANLFLSANSAYDKLVPWFAPDDHLGLIEELGCRPVEVDFAQPGSAEDLFKQALDQLGRIDILVNNAVYDRSADLFSLSEDLLNRHFRVNVWANLSLTAQMIRNFQKTSGGRIINFTSGQFLAPMPDQLPYAITKASIEALTLSLMPQAALKGITINAIDPGPTDTGWMSPEVKHRIKNQAPFGRTGLPFDAANLALFLACEESAWITGQILRSRGGL